MRRKTMKNSVLMALERHDGGALAETADDLMRSVVRDVMRYGTKGAISINLTVEANGERGLKLSASVKATTPKRPAGLAFYWPGADGELSRTPPADVEAVDRNMFPTTIRQANE